MKLGAVAENQPTKNRMKSIDRFSEFNARLREFIRVSTAKGGARSRVQPFSDEVFSRLALELFALQFEHNSAYQHFCRGRGLKSGTVAHWPEVPALPTAGF